MTPGGWNPEKVAVFRDSFERFLEHVKINSKELGGGTVLAEHIYRAQQMFLDGVFDALSEDIHDIYVLKSRQLGLSTITRALSLFWLGMHDGLQGAMVFDTAYNTSRARREIIDIIAALPSALKFPTIIDNNRDALVLSNGSQLLFMQAGVKNSRAGGGLGRSTGLNFTHASEICSWVNDEGLVSFRQTLSDVYPDRLYIWESTARGYNAWYNLWQEAKADETNRRCMFFGWWSKDTQEIERGSPDFSRYGTEPPRPSELFKIKEVEKLYGWRITPEQLAWYRKKTDPTQENDEGDPDDPYLLAEQSWSETESFQATGSTFFQAEKLTECAAQLAAQPKPHAYKFWPGVDFVTCDMQLARSRREVELQIWEEPVSDSSYIVAADPAFGHNERNNNSAVQVLRGYADCIEQVAEYASATIQPHQLAWLLWTLVGYYGSKPGSIATMICELNGPGEEVWRQYQSTKQIVQAGYLRQAARDKGIGDIFNNARSYIYTRSDSMNVGHNYQFKTQVQLKVAIMEALRNYLHNGVFRVRSMPLIEEMRTVTRDGDTIGAENDARDDRTFASALGIRAWDERVRRGLVASNRTRDAERAKVSLTMQDQWNIFQSNQLSSFFAQKASVRRQGEIATARAAWRSQIGRRRVPVQRRGW